MKKLFKTAPYNSPQKDIAMKSKYGSILTIFIDSFEELTEKQAQKLFKDIRQDKELLGRIEKYLDRQLKSKGVTANNIMVDTRLEKV